MLCKFSYVEDSRGLSGGYMGAYQTQRLSPCRVYRVSTIVCKILGCDDTFIARSVCLATDLYVILEPVRVYKSLDKNGVHSRAQNRRRFHSFVNALPSALALPWRSWFRIGTVCILCIVMAILIIIRALSSPH